MVQMKSLEAVGVPRPRVYQQRVKRLLITFLLIGVSQPPVKSTASGKLSQVKKNSTFCTKEFFGEERKMRMKSSKKVVGARRAPQ